MCSATCGEGWQSRTRFCVSSSYSTQCSGPLREQRPCNNSAVCPGKPPPPILPPTATFLRSPSPLLDPASPIQDPPDSPPQALSKSVASGMISTLTSQKRLCLQFRMISRYNNKNVILFSGFPTCRQAGRLLIQKRILSQDNGSA